MRNIEITRKNNKGKIKNKKQTKIDFIVHYTQKKFAPYSSDEDSKLFSNYLMNF
jgi:hypothetical protein